MTLSLSSILSLSQKSYILSRSTLEIEYVHDGVWWKNSWIFFQETHNNASFCIQFCILASNVYLHSRFNNIKKGSISVKIIPLDQFPFKDNLLEVIWFNFLFFLSYFLEVNLWFFFCLNFDFLLQILTVFIRVLNFKLLFGGGLAWKRYILIVYFDVNFKVHCVLIYLMWEYIWLDEFWVSIDHT